MAWPLPHRTGGNGAGMPTDTAFFDACCPEGAQFQRQARVTVRLIRRRLRGAQFRLPFA